MHDGVSLEANGLLILTDVAGIAKVTIQGRWMKAVCRHTSRDAPAGSWAPKSERY
jgi:hypothetical protein